MKEPYDRRTSLSWKKKQHGGNLRGIFVCRSTVKTMLELAAGVSLHSSANFTLEQHRNRLQLWKQSWLKQNNCLLSLSSLTVAAQERTGSMVRTKFSFRRKNVCLVKRIANSNMLSANLAYFHVPGLRQYSPGCWRTSHRNRNGSSPTGPGNTKVFLSFFSRTWMWSGRGVIKCDSYLGLSLGLWSNDLISRRYSTAQAAWWETETKKFWGNRTWPGLSLKLWIFLIDEEKSRLRLPQESDTAAACNQHQAERYRWQPQDSQS